MGFPGSKVHRSSRRKLGRGQYPPVAPVTATATAATTTVTVQLSVPCVISGPFPIKVATISDVPSQVVSSNRQTITLVFGETVVGKAWSITPGLSVCLSDQGGVLAGASGTF
jgi:hypothetical protein